MHVQIQPPWEQIAPAQCAPTLAQQAVQVLMTSDPGVKACLTHLCFRQLQANQTEIGTAQPPDSAQP
jgi:hypothetical protein